jgi:transaldolase
MDCIPIEQLAIKLFADGADLESIRLLNQNPLIKGFTTNPTLMRKAGITNYEEFAHEALSIVPDKPFSFEVFADEMDEMERQARIITSWGENVYVKIPITNTKGESCFDLIKTLGDSGIKLNITAITTESQVSELREYLINCPSAFVSVFAGRIADTGRNPETPMLLASARLACYPNMELLWASTRELLNIYQAYHTGCDIITVTPDILAKIPNINKDLNQFSLETVQMFYKDGQASNFKL